MKSITKTYRFIALSLAILMFSTSVGFAVDMHFCKGDFKSFSFLDKAPSCHEMAQMPTCPHHQKMMTNGEDGQMEERNCCENKTVHVEADQDLQIPTFDLPSFHQVATVAFLNLKMLYQPQGITETPIPFQQYKPPLLLRDIPVLTQTFLL